MVYKEQVSRENLYVDPAAATSRTVALTGSGFPDATNTLVALVNISTSTAIPLPAGGWEERGTGGANGNNQMRVYVKQGDGATNSITIESVSAIATVGIFVVAGYAGLTPIISGGANGGTGTNFPFSGISGQPGNGLTILGIGLATAPSSWSSWSASNPILASQPSTARGWWGVSDYIDGQGSPNSTVTWLGSRSQRYIAVVLPLQQVSANPAVSGSIASQLDPVSQSASATTTDPPSADGSITSQLDPVTQAASATVTEPGGTSGSIASQLDPVSQAASATVSEPAGADGSITSALPAVSSAMTASVGNQLPATTTPKRSQMPAQPFDLYPAPTYSWGAGSAPSGAGYTTINPDSAMVKLLGAARKGTQAGSVAGFVNPAPLQDIAGAGTGTNPLVFPAFGKRILTDSPEVWFKVAQRSYAGFSNVSSRAASRIRVNGKWTSMMPTYLGSTVGFPSNPENITAGEYWFKMTFPDSQQREIELNDHLEFGGVVIPSAYTFSAPRAAEHVLVVLDGSLGAAEKHQTGNFSLNSADGSGAAASYTAVTSYVWALAQILGYDSVVNVGAGSSGFSISGDTASWKSSNKVPVDVLEHLGDLNLIGSANNDQAAGQTPAQVDTASNTVYGSVAAGAKPSAVNVAVGMFTAPAAGSQSTVEASVAPYNDVLKARAQQYGFWFINPATGQVYDPQGNLRLTTSNWVYQDLSDISSDNTHPSQRGANNLGGKMANALLLAHEDDTTVAGAITTALPALTQTASADVAEPAGSSGSIVTALPAMSQSAQADAAPPAGATGAIVSQLDPLSQSAQATAVDPSGLPWLASFEDGVNPYTLGPTSFDSISSSAKRFGDYSLLSDASSSLAHRARVATQTFLPGTVMRGWVRVGLNTPSLAGIGFASPDTLDNVSVLIDTRNSTGITAAFQISENRQAGTASTTGIAASENVVGERWYMIEAVYTGTAVNAKLFSSDGVTLLATLNRTLTQTAGYASYRPTIYGYNTAWYDNISIAESAPDISSSFTSTLPALSQNAQGTVQNPNPGGITVTSKDTTGDLELTYLGTFGAAGSLSDRRKAVYGQSEHAYFAARSGLVPAQQFSLADHKLAYYAAQVGQPGGLRQLERTFYLQSLGL